jgi:hypothetical protein
MAHKSELWQLVAANGSATGISERQQQQVIDRAFLMSWIKKNKTRLAGFFDGYDENGDPKVREFGETMAIEDYNRKVNEWLAPQKCGAKTIDPLNELPAEWKYSNGVECVLRIPADEYFFKSGKKSASQNSAKPPEKRKPKESKKSASRKSVSQKSASQKKSAKPPEKRKLKASKKSKKGNKNVKSKKQEELYL